MKITDDIKTLRELRAKWLAVSPRTAHEESAICALGAVCDNLQGELNKVGTPELSNPSSTVNE